MDAAAPAGASGTARPPADDAGRLAWLRLARSERVGPRSFRKLMTRFGDAGAALDALPDLARGASPCPAERAEAEWRAGERAGARLLLMGEPGYPAALAEIPDPPPLLWALGDPDLAARPCVGVVGARNASAAGRRIAADLARGLGAAGWTVASGLARGIDAAAHEASLETGTLAAMAGGVDVVYPPEHAALAARLAEGGLLISEAPMGERPTARSFPRRNRLVSGVSAGVILVEAAERSGSLITARMALEQGREAMAVPGSPLDLRAAGCNALIRDGAALIRSVEDALEALSGATVTAQRLARRPRAVNAHASTHASSGAAHAPADALSGECALAELLGPTPVSFDELARASGLASAALSAALTDLELSGEVERLPGDLFARTR